MQGHNASGQQSPIARCTVEAEGYEGARGMRADREQAWPREPARAFVDDCRIEMRARAMLSMRMSDTVVLLRQARTVALLTHLKRRLIRCARQTTGADSDHGQDTSEPCRAGPPGDQLSDQESDGRLLEKQVRAARSRGRWASRLDAAARLAIHAGKLQSLQVHISEPRTRRRPASRRGKMHGQSAG